MHRGWTAPSGSDEGGPRSHVPANMPPIAGCRTSDAPAVSTHLSELATSDSAVLNDAPLAETDFRVATQTQERRRR